MIVTPNDNAYDTWLEPYMGWEFEVSRIEDDEVYIIMDGSEYRCTGNLDEFDLVEEVDVNLKYSNSVCPTCLTECTLISRLTNGTLLYNSHYCRENIYDIGYHKSIISQEGLKC